MLKLSLGCRAIHGPRVNAILCCFWEGLIFFIRRIAITLNLNITTWRYIDFKANIKRSACVYRNILWVSIERGSHKIIVVWNFYLTNQRIITAIWLTWIG